jgi:hypothetical protein
MTVGRNLLRVVECHANPARQLIGAAWMFCAGVVFLLIGRGDPRFAYFFGWPLLAGAACFAVYFVWRRAFPGKPVLMLLPQGIIYRVGGVPQAFIPWQVVRGVDTIDFSVGHGKRKIQTEDVTVILVPEGFYRKYFHVGSFRRAASGWEWFFRPMGDLVGIAIHHEWFLLGPDEVRKSIETRWRSFRDEEPALPVPALAGSRFGRQGGHLVLGTHILASGWDAAKIFGPVCIGLLVLAYLLGTA